MKYDAHLRPSWALAAILSVGLSGLNCSGKSDDNGSSSAGSAGTHTAQAGNGASGSSGSGASAGRSSGGSGGSSANGGRGGSAGSGLTSGSSGAAGTTGGAAGIGANGGQAGRGTGGAAGTTGGVGGTTGGAGGTGGDAGAAGGAAGGADTCSGPDDCLEGACWEGLDGVRSCLVESDPVLSECFPADDPTCCHLDSDCSDSGAGRCVPKFNPALSCGGAVQGGNSCSFNECNVDADCTATLPAGATVAACLPRGAFGLFTSTCVYGGCRTNADCTLHDGGECRYDLAATHQGCDLHYVLYCAYPSDPCLMRYQSCDQVSMVCAPEDDYQGRHCVQAPPMYP